MTMVNYREMRIKCDGCNECIMWNKKRVCNVYEKDNRNKRVRNCNDEELESNEAGVNKRSEKNQQETKRNKADRIKVKGLVEEEKRRRSSKAIFDKL